MKNVTICCETAYNASSVHFKGIIAAISEDNKFLVKKINIRNNVNWRVLNFYFFKFF